MEFNALLERKFYSWSIMTYASEDDIRQLCMGAEHWAYIYHDKDESEPHYHVLLKYRSQKRFKTILKELNSEQNTFGEQIKNYSAILQYLTHKKNPEKFQYPDEAIKSDEIEWWSKYDDLEEGKDSPLTVINDILNGVPLRTLLSRYGRTIVFQWRAWSEMAKMIAYQDKGVRLEYERFSETTEEEAERIRIRRLYDNGTFLFDTETGEILENYQKALDNTDSMPYNKKDLS